jgi:hypothetical protein
MVVDADVRNVVGKNSTLVAIPFLNLMSNIHQRGGPVSIRVGGNTQESSKLVDFIPDGRILIKDYNNTSNPTGTPPLDYSLDLFYLMANISTLIDINWYLGVPFFNVTPLDMSTIVHGQRILGDRILGFQIGNEPDQYALHNHRPGTYGPQDYLGEFSDAVAAIRANPELQFKNNLIGPSLASGDQGWDPSKVWDTGYLDVHKDSLKYIAMEHYPDHNCAAQFGGPNDPGVKHPQDELAKYLTHQAGQGIVKPYWESTALAQAAGKPMLMFETNTASCGGFAGISNSFVAAMWGIDYGLQLVFGNFSGANLHVGGQNVFYNPFTPPPTNQTGFHQWTVGPIYYAMLIVAEAIGKTGATQVVDLFPESLFQPIYSIYENGKPTKVVLFNYVNNNASSEHDYTFQLSLEGVQVPKEVKVKYLRAPFVTSKENITWAGQTFGSQFESDGRIKGTLDVKTITCDIAANYCAIPMPAPAVALVFLDPADPAISDGDGGHAAKTYATSAHTRTANTATVDPSLLATSNGQSGKDRMVDASTSKNGLKNGASAGVVGPGVALGAMAAAGWWTVIRVM